jgi:hypothetical protein
MTYDPDERIHPSAPSFLSRAPTVAERRRLKWRLASTPAPRLLFWPESIPIDRAGRLGCDPDSPGAPSGIKPAGARAPDRTSAARPGAPSGIKPAGARAPDLISAARPGAPSGIKPAGARAPDRTSAARPGGPDRFGWTGPGGPGGSSRTR